MQVMHPASIDLNLLVVLHELLRSRNTTIAARRLGRTQSAVSHALQRLRAVLGEPLFLRVAGGLQPTASAEAMKPAVEDLLARATALFSGSSPAFDPSTLARTFAIAATDYTELLILPPLLARLRVEAPNVDLTTSFLGDDLERAIKARDVDLGIGTRFRVSPGLVETRVGDQEMRVLVRRGHPATRGRLTAERYAGFDHVLVTPRGLPGGVVDDALEKVGLHRRVVVRLPHFVVAALLVAESDLVVSVPRAVAEQMAERAALVVLRLPVEVTPFRFSIAYSTLVEADPVHTWFRNVCIEVAARDAGKDYFPTALVSSEVSRFVKPLGSSSGLPSATSDCS